MIQFKKFVIELILILLSPVTFLSTFWLKLVKRAGTGKISDMIFMNLGVLPVLDHYYQPLINPEKHLTKSLREDRNLPGLDLNTQEQLDLLSKFNYNEELLIFPMDKDHKMEFYYNIGAFGSGDSEYLYNMVRYFKPAMIIEVGSGSSTLMVRNGVKNNKVENSDYFCEHICIEPYEQPWLEKTGITVLRKKVEDIDPSFFQKLAADDILFIDSSHIIRPQGDVLFEYLEILPILKPGVLVHVHDIFTPKDYLSEWVYAHSLWNEQYLLEAFLTLNTEFKIIGALNYLSHNYREEFASKCPVFAKQKGREPGSFWMVRK